MNPNELAAALLNDVAVYISRHTKVTLLKHEQKELLPIILTYIEKATEEMKQLEEWLDSATVPRTDKDGRECPLSERVALAIAITESEASRAAHASEPWTDICKQANIVCALSGAVAHDCDHHGITRPTWWRAVKKLQKMVNSADAHNATLRDCGDTKGIMIQ